MTPAVRLSRITQGYGSKIVLADFSLDMSPGVVGLLGPNGAGKTTLLHTLATIRPPRSGTVEILGEAIRSEKDARRIRRQIGFLPQDFGYFKSFSVYDFVRYCAWLREVPRAKVRDETAMAIEAVGLATSSRVKMKSLSGGMLRRAGIAAALVGGPRLIVLDEPTVGLDPAQRLEFREVLRSLQGATVVLSTHLVEDVAAVGDDIVVLSEGAVRFRGSPAQLVAAGAPSAAGDTGLERGYMTVLSNGIEAAV